MNRTDVYEMTVRKINPAARVIDSRRVNLPVKRDTTKATAAWKARSFERVRARWERTLELILAGKTYKEIAKVTGYSYHNTFDFINRYDLPRPARKRKGAK